MPRTHALPFETCRRELEAYAEREGLFVRHEAALRRSDERFALEVSIAVLRGEVVPNFAHARAFETLLVMAKG